jgi:hypothetical protein
MCEKCGLGSTDHVSLRYTAHANLIVCGSPIHYRRLGAGARTTNSTRSGKCRLAITMTPAAAKSRARRTVSGASGSRCHISCAPSRVSRLRIAIGVHFRPGRAEAFMPLTSTTPLAHRHSRRRIRRLRLPAGLSPPRGRPLRVRTRS